MVATEKKLFDPDFLFTPSDSFSLGRTVLPQYKTSQTTDRQTTQCTKGTTDSTIGQKLKGFRQIVSLHHATTSHTHKHTHTSDRLLYFDN